MFEGSEKKTERQRAHKEVEFRNQVTQANDTDSKRKTREQKTGNFEEGPVSAPEVR